MQKNSCSSPAVNLSGSAKAAQGDAVIASGCVLCVAGAPGEGSRSESTSAPREPLVAARRLSLRHALAQLATGWNHVEMSVQRCTPRAPVAVGQTELPRSLDGWSAAGKPPEEGDALGLQLARLTLSAHPASARTRCLTASSLRAHRAAVRAGDPLRMPALAVPVGGGWPRIAGRIGPHGDAAFVSPRTTTGGWAGCSAAFSNDGIERVTGQSPASGRGTSHPVGQGAKGAGLSHQRQRRGQYQGYAIANGLCFKRLGVCTIRRAAPRDVVARVHISEGFGVACVESTQRCDSVFATCSLCTCGHRICRKSSI